MDHHYNVGASGTVDGNDDKYYYGRRANGFYIVRFANLFADKRNYLRGFGYQGSANRSDNWGRACCGDDHVGGATTKMPYVRTGRLECWYDGLW